MKYWAFMNGEVPGSFAPEELAALPGFSMTTLVCPAQGEIAEKNWRRAGEFSDIAAALSARERAAPPPAPAPVAGASASADVDAMIDHASTKLFSHVADLMKELENRREEKGLIASLQRQIAVLKDELSQTRERANLLEMRLPRINELEEALRKERASLEAVQTSLLTREQSLSESRIAAEKFKNDSDAAKRRLQEAQNDLAVRNRLVDKLSKDLSEKELSLAKSLGVIRRLEEDLNRLCPDPALMAALARTAAAAQPPAARPPAPVQHAPAVPAPLPLPVEPVAAGSEPPALTEPAIPPAPEPLAAPDASSAAELPPSPTPYTLDEPPPTPPYLEPSAPTDQPKAQQALVSFLKRFFPGQSH